MCEARFEYEVVVVTKRNGEVEERKIGRVKVDRELGVPEMEWLRRLFEGRAQVEGKILAVVIRRKEGKE